MEEAGLEKNKAPRDPHRRHEILWRIFWAPVRLIAWLKFGFVPVKARVKGPFLLVSNHNTNWDPLLVGCSFFREQMYFVASEHIFRSPLAGKLIAWAQDPIPRQKGGSAAATVKARIGNTTPGSTPSLVLGSVVRVAVWELPVFPEAVIAAAPSSPFFHWAYKSSVTSLA